MTVHNPVDPFSPACDCGIGKRPDGGARAVVLDQRRLEELRRLKGADAPDFLQTVVDCFVVDSSRLMTLIRQSLTEGDLVLLVRSAHSLKSGSLTVGALELARHGAELEELAKLAAIADATARLPELERSHRDACEALRRECT